MKTSDQIMDEVSGAMVAEFRLHRDPGEPARSALAWELVSGDTLIVEYALDDLVRRAIEADRAQRDPNEDGTLRGATIIALKDRVIYNPEAEQALTKAIEFVEADPDAFWEEFADPMLVDIEGKFS